MYILYLYLKNFPRYSNKNCNIWYDHLKPVHLHINKEITDVLFNTPKFEFSSK